MKSVWDFLVVLLVGSILGGVLVLAWQKGCFESMAPGDIGGLLAGLSTMGLFGIAWLAKDEWKHQQDRQLKMNSLIKLHQRLNSYFYEARILGFSIIETNLNSPEASKQTEKVILTASLCEPEIVTYESLAHKRLSHHLTPNFSYQRLYSRMEEDTFDKLIWKDIIDEHSFLAEKALSEELSQLTKL